MSGIYGLLAEFETPGQLLEAARAVRDEGYTRWDCHSPFPVHGMDRAMGLRDTRLPWVVLGAGMTGTAVAILMQWWMNAKDYPLVISGKPLFSLPANIPVAFELTVLFAAVTTFAAMFVFNNLPKFYHPAFRSRRFRQVTTDKFFITIEAADPRFDAERTEKLLRSLGSAHVERLEE
jgi:hypothetical protein